ncbi:hypothetical protein DICVIV_02956 [Dictyocaulus viviparus]|uniref:Tetraspanin family protein n=1 Tax=Dictyocaulus viviparus TaxID=29172 RepID=A0A0D8Y3Z1_DICVI|nr:hypothetical protein DICVIV_02956 [Dictyocaulus viviparus]
MILQSAPDSMVETNQRCCGGVGPRDYYHSFWFITNTVRGTTSFVPPSCCRQSQSGRAWSAVPVDPMCTTYHYNSQAFNASVYNVGCQEKLLQWLNEQTYIFAAVGFSFGALMVDSRLCHGSNSWDGDITPAVQQCEVLFIRAR